MTPAFIIQQKKSIFWEFCMKRTKQAPAWDYFEQVLRYTQD